MEIIIEYWVLPGGRNYVGEFIQDLPLKTIKKIDRQLELVEKYGIIQMMRIKTMKKLKGYDLYEIIINFNKVCYRILCVIRQTTLWLIHIFIKKTEFTPQWHIKTALDRAIELDNYLISLKNNRGN